MLSDAAGKHLQLRPGLNGLSTNSQQPLPKRPIPQRTGRGRPKRSGARRPHDCAGGSLRSCFAYDSSEIDEESRLVLREKATILNDHLEVSIRIDGHADERGSVEYNLALSLRRANAVKEYLVQLGLDASRFDVIPMGEERPLSMGTDEAAFQQNRRGEFHITRGGDNLVPVNR